MTDTTPANPITLLADAIRDLDEKDGKVKAVFGEVARLTRLLDEAKKELQSTDGYHRRAERRNKRTGLNAVHAAIMAGNKAIVVKCSGYQAQPIPGAVLKVTAARATVLTERGEMVFNLKATSWRSAGAGMADHSSYNINPSDLT